MNKKAVIDLGTNTFHILVFEKENQQINRIFSKRIFVQLAEDGVHKIGPRAYARALDAIRQFKTIIEEYAIQECKVVGTSAMRRSNNAKDLADDIEFIIGSDVSIISGDQEADYIYQGNKLAVSIIEKTYLVMDIGGGSVEFIIVKNNEKVWAESFDIGMLVLFHEFMKDSLTLDQHTVESIKNYLSIRLSNLKEHLLLFKPEALVGSAGTFDVIEQRLSKDNNEKFATIDLINFKQYCQEHITLDFEKRLLDDSLPTERKKLMPLALVLMEYIVDIMNPDLFIVSHYAMKEGIAIEM